MQNIIDKLLDRGYEYREWSESYVKGFTRVYFNDNLMHVNILINDKELPIAAKSVIDTNLDLDKVLAVLEVLEQ